MKYEVFHAKNPNFGFGGHPAFVPENYEKVAEVEVENVDEAFRVTNHIDEPWWKNPEVKWHKDQSRRSTSVGDVVVGPDGKRYLCDMVGWKVV
jgi:hypothetical protein